MRTWLGQLFSDETERADEMALIALLIGFCFGLALLSLRFLEFDAVMLRHAVFSPESFSAAADTIFGTGGKVVAFMAIGMGLKKRLGA